MSQETESVVALWDSPSWATSTWVDQGSIEFRCKVGEVEPMVPDAPFSVDVVQRDELDLDAAPISITRTPPHVSVAGVWLAPDRARELARLLVSAADVIEN